MTEHVRIFEVGPRDGLQNEPRLIPTRDKIDLINRLAETGLDRIEATSFVSPKWVPQMGDAADVMAGISRREGVGYAALTPNLRGYAAAREAGMDEVAIFASASEGFSRANINCSIDESFARFQPVVEAAHADGIPVRGYVSCVIVCPFDGPVDPGSVGMVTLRLLALGCYEVSLGDTTGAGRPDTVGAMLETVLGEAGADKLAGHFHDTGGAALDNISLGLDMGLRVFDSAIGGLGGCPYAPGAPGNVATEEVADLITKKGFATSCYHDQLRVVAKFARRLRSSDQYRAAP